MEFSSCRLILAKPGSSSASPISTPPIRSSPPPRPTQPSPRPPASRACACPQIIKTVFDGYADRPALGQRVVRFVEDPQTHRTTAELVAQFETITYRELWDRVQAVAGAWSGRAVQPGDRVAILGFTSVDYTTIDLALTQLGAVSVPLQTSAGATQLQPIVAETEPTVIASSIDYLDDAVDLVLAGPAPKRLVVFDFRPEVDDQRESLAAARDRLAGTQVTVTTLADEIAYGTGRSVEPAATTEADPLALLIYTSGSTGAPKGAMYPAHKVADMWGAAAAHWDDRLGGYPAIVLSFMPMSHVMGRGALYGTLSTGGTVYFAARPDLSTFLEDLALTRPTQLNLVPRVWDMIHQEVQSEVDRATRPIEAQVLAETAQQPAGRPVRLGDDRLGPDRARTQGVGRDIPGHAPDRGLRLHRSRCGVRRRRGAPSPGHRLQAGRRSRTGLLRHRPAASAR